MCHHISILPMAMGELNDPSLIINFIYLLLSAVYITIFNLWPENGMPYSQESSQVQEAYALQALFLKILACVDLELLFLLARMSVGVIPEEFMLIRHACLLF